MICACGRSRPRASCPALVSRSLPSKRSAVPGATRIALICEGEAAKRIWVVTAPPFCASPAISINPTPLPSICAAMPSNAPRVTTPVPPTPVIKMLLGWSRSRRGFGNGKLAGTFANMSGLRSWPPSMVTKLGQKPLRQDTSLLQAD